MSNTHGTTTHTTHPPTHTACLLTIALTLLNLNYVCCLYPHLLQLVVVI